MTDKMTDVVRHDTDCDVYECKDGGYVTYEDYAAMRAKVWQEAIESVLKLEEEIDGGFGDMFDSIDPCDVRNLTNPYEE